MGDQVDAKVVVLGNRAVGKTCIAKRYVEGTFSLETKTTIAAAFMTKRVVVDGRRLRLQIWDTAGQERFRSMAPMYYRGASAAVLAFDLTSQESYVAVKDWVKELHGNVDSELVVAIAGNKVDMTDDRQVETKVAAEYAKSIGALYVETSAKDNIGIDELFFKIAQQVIDQPVKPLAVEDAVPIVDAPPPPKAKGCC